MHEWRVLDSKILIDSEWLRVRQESCLLPNGTTIHGYYLLEGKDVVAIVPITPKGKAVLVEQYKHGIGKTVLEFPAGYIEAHDPSPEEAARRELAEETGYQARHLRLLGSLVMDPTRSPNVMHVYLASDVRPVARQSLDTTENIEVKLVPFHLLTQEVRETRILAQSSLAALLLAQEALKDLS